MMEYIKALEWESARRRAVCMALILIESICAGFGVRVMFIRADSDWIFSLALAAVICSIAFICVNVGRLIKELY